jgi:chromatin segregation and condensation protein Rec8/ScpA/Scc1 (kleisin family)
LEKKQYSNCSITGNNFTQFLAKILFLKSLYLAKNFSVQLCNINMFGGIQVKAKKVTQLTKIQRLTTKKLKPDDFYLPRN